MAKKYTGWSYRGRPFSPAQFKNSYIKRSFKGSYSKYLQEYARQYKNSSLRKSLKNM